MARKLKFGSPAWRKKYMKKKRTNKLKRNGRTKSRSVRAGKRKRMKEMIREAAKVRKNPPRKWMNVRAVRVVRKNGHDVLEVKR